MSETATAPVPTPAISARPTEPLRRRILRALLYGKADRSMKARGRIGLAMLAFTSIYAIIAGRLAEQRRHAHVGRQHLAASIKHVGPRGGHGVGADAARCWRPTCACLR